MLVLSSVDVSLVGSGVGGVGVVFVVGAGVSAVCDEVILLMHWLA